MGARQSRQSVNITTPAASKDANTTNDATAANTATAVITSTTSDIADDIKNIIGESGVSTQGKIESIPDMDILTTDTAAATVDGGSKVAGDQVTTTLTTNDETKCETKESSDEPAVVVSASTETATSTITESPNNTSSSSEVKKGKKLKKKWSLRNISFSRKDKNKPSKENKDKSVVATVAEVASVAATGTETEAPAATNTDESVAFNVSDVAMVTKKNDLTESPSTDKVSVAEPTESPVVDKDTIIIQETIKEEDVNTITTTTNSGTADQQSMVKRDEETVTRADGAGDVLRVEPTSAVVVNNDSLNEKMINLTIRDDKVESTTVSNDNVVITPDVKPVVNVANNGKIEESVKESTPCNGMMNGSLKEVEPEVQENVAVVAESIVEPTATESLPEPVIELANGDNKSDDVILNGNSAVMNGNGNLNGDEIQIDNEIENENENGQSTKEQVDDNMDMCPLPSPPSPINLTTVDIPSEIAAKKNVQKQVMEKAHEMLDVENNIMESTNGFSSSPAVIED